MNFFWKYKTSFVSLLYISNEANAKTPKHHENNSSDN